jgi:hypothetical protein
MRLISTMIAFGLSVKQRVGQVRLPPHVRGSRQAAIRSLILGLGRQRHIGAPLFPESPHKCGGFSGFRLSGGADKGCKKGRGATWGLLEMTMRDPDGLALIFVEVPPEHPRRRG